MKLFKLEIEFVKPVILYFEVIYKILKVYSFVGPVPEVALADC